MTTVENAAEPDSQVDGPVNVRAILWTLGITAGVALSVQLSLLFIATYGPNGRWAAAWAPLVAIALTVVPLVTFGGFYIASRRARVAIMASFLLTFLTMLPLALTLPKLGLGAPTGLSKTLVDQFSSVVGTLIIFYFGSETIITGAKLVTTSQKPEAAAQLARADRDLPAAAPPPQPPPDPTPANRSTPDQHAPEQGTSADDAADSAARSVPSQANGRHSNGRTGDPARPAQPH
jgi:hypothetical protein